MNGLPHFPLEFPTSAPLSLVQSDIVLPVFEISHLCADALYVIFFSSPVNLSYIILVSRRAKRTKGGKGNIFFSPMLFPLSHERNETIVSRWERLGFPVGIFLNGQHRKAHKGAGQ